MQHYTTITYNIHRMEGGMRRGGGGDKIYEEMIFDLQTNEKILSNIDQSLRLVHTHRFIGSIRTIRYLC